MVDHKPLVPILNDYAWDMMENQRILRLRLKMQRYVFTARCIPGKNTRDTDTLSRTPNSNPSTEDQLGEGPVSFTVINTALAMIDGSDAATLDPVLESQGCSSYRHDNAGATTGDLERIPQREVQPVRGNTPVLDGL